MIFVEENDGTWRMWAAAIDEAYGRNPYAHVSIRISPDTWTRKVPIEDVTTVANMLRVVADDMDKIAKAWEARERFREKCIFATDSASKPL